jgi:excisionase family DNA binding protein
VINSDTGRKNHGKKPKRAHHPAQLLETVEDTAARLSIGRSQVYELLRLNQIEAVKFGKSRRIVIASTLRLVERLRSGAAA